MTYIACYLFGALTFGLLMMVVLMCIHRRPPVTFHHRRKNRDAPERNLFSELKEGVEELERMREPRLFGCIDCGALKPMDALSWGLCEACQENALRDSQNRHATEVGGIDYKWLGITGHEK